MYGKVFSSLWDGTLATNWPGWSLLVFMIANCDPDGTIDMTPEAMAARTGIPLDEVRSALAELSSPDPRSRSREEEGRRIVLLDPDNRDWGWSIVNYRKYREFTDAETVRQQNRVRKKKQRDKSRSVTHGHASSRQAEVEVEAEVEEESKHSCPTALDDELGLDLPPNQEETEDLPIGKWFTDYFWPLYPRKEGRARALKAMQAVFRGLSKRRGDELGDVILDGLQRYRAHCEGKDKQYIKMAEGWISNRRWEDDFDA